MNSDRNSPEFDEIQNLILWLIAFGLIYFITGVVLDAHIILEIFVFLIFYPLFGMLVMATARNLLVLFSLTPWKSILQTGALILLVPAVMTGIYREHYHDYMTTTPSNNRVLFRVTTYTKRTGGAGSLGSDLVYNHTINSTSVESGSSIELNVKKPFTVTSTITEVDDIDDVGTTSKEYRFSKNPDYTKAISVIHDVEVVERGGRKNAGSYAVFSVGYSLNRILPENFTFFDVYFYTHNQTASSILWCILLLGIGGVAYSVYIIYAGNKRTAQLKEEKKLEEERRIISARLAYAKMKEKERLAEEQRKEAERLAEEQRRQEKERELQKEKDAFIASLGGHSLRDVAGVPSHIKYHNGMPVDNNNAEYGSFTVYLSRSGKCFHGQKGCCSAHKPIHYFTARKNYKPCSKCQHRYTNIPNWHTKYTTLKNRALWYGIDEQ